KLQVLARLQGSGFGGDGEDDGDTAAVAPPDSAALASAVAYVERSLERNFARRAREDRFERSALFLGAAAAAVDPHTAYMKPENREDFNVAMSGTLEGIGATLREDDG